MKNNKYFGLISLEEAISHCYKIESDPNTNPSSALAHAQLASWLEELMIRRSDDPLLAFIDESIGKCPTMKEAQKIFKKNGYRLDRQRGSHQIWKKDEDPIPIVLPYHSRDNEQVRPGDWKKIVKEHRLNLDL